MWLHINFIECLCPYISTGFNNIACKSLYFVATWKHIEKASSLAGCLVPSTVICRHQVQGTPMLSNSLCIWQTAHGPQHANAQKSLQAEPCNESKFDFFFSYSFSDEYETMHQYIVNALYYSSSQRHKSVELRIVTKPWHCEDVYYYTCTYTRLHKMTPPKLKKLKT